MGGFIVAMLLLSAARQTELDASSKDMNSMQIMFFDLM